MVENELCKALRGFLAEAVKDFRFETGQPGQAKRAPQIVNGYLPPKRVNNADFPFIVVRPGKGSADRDGVNVTVSLVIGCYSEDYDGYQYCMNILSRIRTALFTLPSLTLDGRYRFNYPLDWELYDEQPYPQWEVIVTTEWTTGAPQSLLEWED